MLKLGSKGVNVVRLQKTLGLVDDGIFGRDTDRAVRGFQRAHGLVADGLVGPKTATALAGESGRSKPLSQADIEAASRTLNVDVAAVLAVNEVESRGAGFIPGTRLPVLLFERHIMYRRMRHYGLNAEAARETHPDLVNPRPGGYKGGVAEHKRFGRAVRIDRRCAIEAASWGLFQILGEHWSALDYANAEAFAAAMHVAEADQLEAFVRFVNHDPALRDALAEHQWARFAARYNGPDYRDHDYDHRLAAAWRRHAGAAEQAAAKHNGDTA